MTCQTRTCQADTDGSCSRNARASSALSGLCGAESASPAPKSDLRSVAGMSAGTHQVKHFPIPNHPLGYVDPGDGDFLTSIIRRRPCFHTGSIQPDAAKPLIIRRNPCLPMQYCDNFPMNTVTALSSDPGGSTTGLRDTEMTAKGQRTLFGHSVCGFVAICARQSFGAAPYLSRLESRRAAEANP